ncbi:MAG: DNA repair protein RecO [Cereibacter sphaeroides]|uniref:DNA repair protein RecO n=1 Tax=Cereibacter sphaeroides TaxID=1063 RepID=A0A2W5SFG3_CERSP|nr:MAG: DNA repair protein RecO [Cereibacter sphaeroides]
MEWRDQGVLLAVRRHGESAAIIEVFTAAHGRHLGVVRGGASRKAAPILQPGAQLDLTWRARLDEHMGAFAVEPLRLRTGLMSDRIALAGLNAICTLLSQALPERDPHPALFAPTTALLDGLSGDGWAIDYLMWEKLLLEEVGFGLDLTACAVTGAREDLAYVSPRTGRAVSRAAAGPWLDRLLPLPVCLTGGPADAEGLAAGLRLTGHFLERELTETRGRQALPEARGRLVDLLMGAGSQQRSGEAGRQ